MYIQVYTVLSVFIFSKILPPEYQRVQLFKTLAQALTDFNELNPSAPVQLLLEVCNRANFILFFVFRSNIFFTSMFLVLEILWVKTLESYIRHIICLTVYLSTRTCSATSCNDISEMA